jgi:anhydro-N-acetylmuramic acid kinase
MKGLFIGIMSGTSLDGADAVLVECTDEREAPVLLGAASAPFDDELRNALLDLQRSGADELHRAALAANRLADLYTGLVARLWSTTGLTADAITAIGAHGQTVRHRPELGYTLQINAPARLAERTGVAVVADFRSRDVAAGGHGAPLVPAFHDAVFRRPATHRVVLNLGGMSNVTDLPADVDAPVRGWDCGPGNVLLDGWIHRHHGRTFDADGAWAASGTVDPVLLERLAAASWFAQPPPKSTGRDLFDPAWLDAALREDGRELRAADVQATLAALSARVVVDSIVRDAGAPDQLIVCGGGAYNTDLIGRIGQAFAAAGQDVQVSTSDAHGIAPEHVEAMAFAWLAMRCVAQRPGSLPAVTGAAGPRVLGAIYPH